MKILTLVWSIGIGGTERAAVNFAIGYKKFGNDSRILVLGEGHERYPDLQEAGVDTTLVTKFAKGPEDIYSEFQTWNPDIIHIHNYSDALLVYVNLIKGVHTRVVETNVFSRPNFDKGYRVVDLSMQLSAWGYWKYKRLMKGAAYIPEVAIVPNIVDASKFTELAETEICSFLSLYNIPANAYIIGRLGQAHPYKWDIRLLDVIKRTIDPANNIYYLLVGVPNILATLIGEEGDFFKSRVIQIDKIEGDSNLSRYYHSLNCFAHISKIGESFGYVLAEAMICKVPVITMLTPLKDNAQFEVVGHEYGGFCVTNTNEFVEAVQKLYNNKQLASSIKTNLNDWIQQRFSYKAVIPKQVEMYHELLAGNRLPLVDVSSIIRDNMTRYKGRAWVTAFLINCLNSPAFYNITSRLKNLSNLFLTKHG